MPILRRILDSLFSESAPTSAPTPETTDGYDLQIVPAGAAADFAPSTARVGLQESAAVAFSPGPAGTLYEAHVRARKGNGRVGDAASVPLRLVSDGTQLVARPNTPRITEVRPLAGGDVRVRWEHDEAGATVEAASFALYSDDGTGGDINLARTIATASRYARSLTVDSSALATAGIPWVPGTRYRLVLRALTADGVHDGNLSPVVAIPRHDAPPGLADGALQVLVS